MRAKHLVFNYDFLREGRTAKRLTQQQLANMIGVDDSTISGWERGRTDIPNDILIQLCRFFGIDRIDQLAKSDKGRK